MSGAAKRQEAAVEVWPLVVRDMERTSPRTRLAERGLQRGALGRKRYGVALTPHNGRDNLLDALEEALDLCAYLKAECLMRPDCDTRGWLYLDALRMAERLHVLLAQRDGVAA